MAVIIVTACAILAGIAGIIILIRIIITRRKLSERLQITLDVMPLCINIWNKNKKLVDCNEEALRMFEADNKKEYLENFHKYTPEYQPDGRKSSKKGGEQMDTAFETGFFRGEWVHQKLNGVPIPCDVTLVRVKLQKDYFVVAYIRDMRELRSAMARVVNERIKFEMMAHWYKSILDAVPLPISVTDTESNWTFVNSKVEEFLGVKLEDIKGKPCSNWEASICNTANCGIECAKRGKKQTYFTHNNSSYQVDVEILNDINGVAAGYIEVVQDVTRLEQMAKKQMEAESVSQAKSAFLAKMSHEIRTPLNAIIGITDIQLHDDMIPESIREALSKIYNSGNLLLGIINDILDLSKIEAGKLDLTPISYDVASLINDTVHLNMTRIESKQIEFILQVDENIPVELFGDDLRIKQILNNLLSNAFKYTEKGRVLLSVSSKFENEEDKSIVTLIFKVSDTGYGMTPEQVSKVFDEYTRFNLEANRTTEGAGLGMNITRHLVRLMNGEIYVESKIDEGSSFTVYLPQNVTNHDAIGKELAENLQRFQLSGAPQLKKLHLIRESMPYGSVLIVDDVETNLYVAKGLLLPYDLRLETAISGYETIEKIKAGKTYDIIFMDHMMPKMDGIETTKILRSMGYTQSIVALTANALAGQAEVFMNSGFDDFISKPIDIRQLNASLNKLIRDKQPPEVVERARRKKADQQKYAAQKPQPIGSELADIFARDAERVLSVLETVLQNNYNTNDDVQMFIINIHAMKSALANIGEPELSDIAGTLEQAGREGDIDVMTMETPAFLEALRSVINKVKSGEEEGEIIEKDSNEALLYLRENLLIIQVACSEYDKKTAKKTLNKLRERAWSLQIRKLINSISDHLLYSEFDEAAALAEEFVYVYIPWYE